MNEILNEATFENQMRGMNDRQLAEFTARQVYDTCKTLAIHDAKLTALSGKVETLESRDRRQFGFIGSIGAVIGAVLAAAADFIWKKVGS